MAMNHVSKSWNDPPVVRDPWQIMRTEVKKGGLAVMAGGEVKADGKFSGGNEAAGFGG